VQRIVGQIDSSRTEEATGAPFQAGDPVKVNDGPFMDFSGTVSEINMERRKVKVMVSIFGRPTPVELDFLQVDLVKAKA
jgi:transcriptional antiterminator NusG